MKKKLPVYLRSLLLSGMFLILGTTVYANHIVGMDLNYQFVSSSGTSSTYQITLVAYGDCAASTFPSLATAAPVVCIYNAGVNVTSVSLTLQAPTAGLNVTNVCPADTGLTTCANTTSSIPGIKKFVYTGTYVITGTSHFWRFIFDGNMGITTSAGRALSITSISSSPVTTVQLVDTLDNTVGNNTNVNLPIIPTPYYCLNEPANYNPGANDVDADSLVFALVPAINGSGSCGTISTSTVTYLSGYSASAPISTTSAFAFSRTNGQISFTSSLPQRSIAVYNIREYRLIGGVPTFVGSSQREMSFTLQTCSAPAPTGSIRTPTDGAVLADSTTFESCINSGIFSFTVAGHETDPTVLITMTPSNIPVGATFTLSGNGTTTPVGTFTWTSTGVTAGTYTFDVLYSANNCPVTSSASVAYSVIVEPIPSAITGTPTVCTGETTTLGDALTGGVWTSSNTALATAGSSSGIISGVSLGLDTITYSYSAAACKVSTPVTVTGAAAIGGTATVCPTLTTTLTESVTGGVWTSGTIGVATVGSTTGIVTGVTGGTSTISYTITSTGCFVTKVVTVTALAAVTPPTGTVCIGNTITLTDATTGGIWSSSSSALATVSSTGIVGGVASGVVSIFYTVGTCYSTASVTVSATGPAAITPSTAAIVCVGGTTTLADASTGGTWSSSSLGVATVGTTTGIVTGVTAGAATISYFLGGCYVVKPVTVISGIAAIAPATATTLCIGSTASLTETTTGGTWSSNALAVATVGSTGTVTAVSAGTAIISYTIGTCFVTKTVTVEAGPLPISPAGPVTICLGTTTTLTDPTTGGTWSSSPTTVASVTSGGVVTGATIGTATISYTQLGCSVTVTASVIASPAAILPASALICTGNTTTLTESVTGGTWSSSASGVASVTSGVVTGVTVGTATISYSIGSCIVSAPVTVNLAPDPGLITGASIVCVGGTTPLADLVTGGTWSSGTTAVATVSAAGIVTGVSAGTALISYSKTASCGTVSTTHLVSVNVSPTAGTITGSASVCSGTTDLLSDVVTGGTWSASNGHATVNSTSGLVTGVSPGIDTISYTVTSSCGTVATTLSVTVGPTLSAGTITGPASILCAGATLALADATTGGTWSATNSSASVNASGLVTGASGGLDTINYTVTSGCGAAVASYPITVNAIPSAAPIVGAGVVCIGSSSIFTDASTGGVWLSTNTTTATVTSGGSVTGAALGTSTISYTITNGCGTSTATTVVTVSATVSAGTITGVSSLCIGSTSTFTDAGGSGGVWSASNSSASVSSTGLVTGLAAGVDTIFYTVTAACGTAVATQVVSVNTTVLTAGTITGPSSVCTGSLISLFDATGGGAWSSSNAHATVTTGGLVTGISPGVDTISYTITSTCGIASTTQVITINSLSTAGTISGPSIVCVGSSITLTDLTSGGVWSSLNTNASVGSTSGIVTGLSAGADVITYTITNSCGTIGTTTNITVSSSATAGTIVGPDTVCQGLVISLSDAVGGGTWTSGNTNATVSAGFVTGVSAGTVPISYSVANSCGTAVAIKIITVAPAAVAGSITGPTIVCAGSGITLVDAATGGTWVASNGNATVVGPGIIDGVTPGTDTIFYVVSNACGSSSASHIITIHVSPIVPPAVGPTHQCTGTLILLIDATTGGVWSSSDPIVASINAVTGVITGMGVGIANLSYTLTNAFGCSTSVTSLDTVTASPGLTGITGSSTACVGASTTLGNATSGGVWSSGDAAIATINPVSGVLTGVSTGTVIISYSVVNSCGTSFTIRAEVINPLPFVAPISGPGATCIGSSITLTDGTSGGVWSSSDVTIASVGASTGVVTGIGGGTVLISYTYSGGSCPVTLTAPILVNAAPFVAAISGTTSECIGTTTSLSDGTFGGVWSSSNPLIASVNTSGVVNGVAPGTATISYTITGGLGCTASAVVIDTVLAIPASSPITGVRTTCAGSSTTLSNASPDGAWSSRNTAIATVDPLTGVVTGVSGGTDEIYYTISDICGSALDSTSITINPAPFISPILATFTTICAGTTIHLTDATTGGVWSSSNRSIATINSTTGMVTAISGGTDTIVYSITNASGCSNSTMVSINIAGAISAASVSPLGSVTLCHGHTVYMHVVSASGTGTTYQWLLNGGAITGATDVAYTATSIGIYSVLINNGSCSETITGPTVVSPPNPVISFTPPNRLSTTSFPAYQWFLNGVLIPGANGSSITETGAGVYKVVVTDYNSCSDTSGGYVVTGGGTNGLNTVISGDDIKVYPNPTTSVVHIDAPVIVNVSVVSVDGKVLISKKDVTSVDVTSLADGMYIIMIYDENNLLLKATKFAKAE